MGKDIDFGELGIGDFDSLRIFLFIELGPYFQPFLRCRARDKLNDGAITAQRFAAPIYGDEGKEPMLDFVPFAGSRRQMADRDREVEFIGQFLQFDFP